MEDTAQSLQAYSLLATLDSAGAHIQAGRSWSWQLSTLQVNNEQRESRSWQRYRRSKPSEQKQSR
jgi:hypothetical protein